MKKLLLLYCFSSFYFLAEAQIAFTLLGGVNFNDFDESSVPDGFGDFYQPNTGFHFGAGALIPLADRLRLIPELQFIQRGANFNGSFNGYESRFNIEYIELPICLSYNAVWDLHIEVGVSLAYVINAFVNDGGEKNDANEFMSNTMEFGINAGLRYEVTKRIAVQGRYYYGMTSILGFSFVDDNGMLSNAGFYNRNVQLGLSYRMSKA